MNKADYIVVFDLFGVAFSKGFKSSRDELLNLFKKDEEVISNIYKKWERLFDLGLINENEFWGNINSELGTDVESGVLTETVLSNYEINTNVLALIKYLKKNFKVIIYSNFRRIWFDRLDKKYGISKLVDDVHISSDTKILKPDTAVFTFLSRKYRHPINKFILIDDNPDNIKGAKLAGAKSILFDNVFEVEPKIRKILKDEMPDYDESYSGIFVKNLSGKFLFQIRDNKPTIANPGKVSVFGGRSKNFETPLKCAIREIKEEISLESVSSDFKKIKIVSCPIENGKWMKCFYYLLEDINLLEVFQIEGQGIKILKKEEVSECENFTQIVKTIFETYFLNKDNVTHFDY